MKLWESSWDVALEDIALDIAQDIALENIALDIAQDIALDNIAHLLFAQWPSFYCLSLPERLPAGPLGSFHDGQGKYACSNTHHSGPKTGPNPSPVHLAASNTLAPPTLLRKKEPMGFSSYDCMNKT